MEFGLGSADSDASLPRFLSRKTKERMLQYEEKNLQKRMKERSNTKKRIFKK